MISSMTNDASAGKVPSGLLWSRGLKSIFALAQREPVETGRPRYQLYVLEVACTDGSAKFDYYVGSTGQPLEKRRAQHLAGGLYASHFFKRPGIAPGRFRFDLMEGLPKFRCELCAKNAEGHLARVITAQVGPAYSDQTRNRRKGNVKPCKGRGTSSD